MANAQVREKKNAKAQKKESQLELARILKRSIKAQGGCEERLVGVEKSIDIESSNNFGEIAI